MPMTAEKIANLRSGCERALATEDDGPFRAYATAILALLDEIEALRAALAWIDNSDPEIVAAAEAKFGFSLSSPEGTK